MRKSAPLRLAFLFGALCLALVIGCKGKAVSDAKENEASSNKVEENIDPDERAVAAKLKPIKDPIQEEIYAFRIAVRQAYNSRRFDELEQRAVELRATKPAFGDGSWKISQFYDALECNDQEPEGMWRLHERIHRDWIAAKAQSIAAQVAYAEFLTAYAWRARGSGYANTVTEEGWQLFRQRLASARKVLEESRELAEKDPCWWLAAERVALGESLNKIAYDSLVAEATAFEPKFWGYDTARAYSLLPRWQGRPGDWEAYAEQAAARPNGLGAETYARIVMYLHGFYDNVFRETNASWPKVREGLEQMRKKYPDSLDILSESAVLATQAEDRVVAKELFDQLGDRYLPSVWRGKPERLAHYRHWAETGQW